MQSYLFSSSIKGKKQRRGVRDKLFTGSLNREAEELKEE